jgi:hypothetical protein
MTTAMVATASTTVTIDLIDKITMIAGPILATITGIDVIIAAMTGVTTTVTMTVTTDVTTTEVIAATTNAMITTTTDEMISAMIDIARMTTIATTIIRMNGLHRHHPKGATPMVRYRSPTVRSTSPLAVVKQPKATDRTDQMLEKSGTTTPKTHSLCIGPNSQSLSRGKIIGFTSLTPRLTGWSLTP